MIRKRVEKNPRQNRHKGEEYDTRHKYRYRQM